MHPAKRKRSLWAIALLLLVFVVDFCCISAQEVPTKKRQRKRMRRRQLHSGASGRGKGGRTFFGERGGGDFEDEPPVRCIVRGEPVVVANVERRRPNGGFHQGMRVGGTDRTRGGGRNLSYGRGTDVYWPSVKSEEDCFYGVFAIQGTARRRAPPRGAAPSPSRGPSATNTKTPSSSSPPAVGVTAGPASAAAAANTPTRLPSPTVSNAPSSVVMPSLLPGGTPSLQPAATSSVTTTAPTTLARSQPKNVVTRQVDVTMDFGFYFGAEVQAPTQEELNGILKAIQSFYGKILKKSPLIETTFKELEVTLVSSNFDASKIAKEEGQDTFPFSLVMKINASFLDGTGVPIPTGDQLVMTLEAADYADFIENHAWLAEPLDETLFYETEVVQFAADTA